MQRPIYRDFAYKGVEERSIIESVVKSRQHVYANSGSNDDHREQKLATFLSTPTHIDGDEVLVRMTEFSDDNWRESGAMFDAMIAETTGRHVMSTNLPGIDFFGKDETKSDQMLTTEQIEDLKNGSFRKIGGSIMHSVNSAAETFSVTPNYVLLGTSMSTALTAAALHAAYEASLTIKGATLAEPINLIDRSFTALASQFVYQPTASGYVAVNPQLVREVSEPISTIVRRVFDVPSLGANKLYAQALKQGNFIADLGDMDHLQNVPIYLTRGAASKVSPEEMFVPLAVHLSQVADVETEVFGDKATNPHDHPYVLTVQSFIDAAENVLNRQS
ncbi:MAG: hypothetical protein JWO99_691 [Candidatus Saccharibacteria bacterium]|nr:hypothetical protein [Candidatus Saccharibacteria bacterium]